MLLLATFKSAQCFLECTLCLDGSTTTKPDHFIGLTSPYVLNTCKEFSNALLSVDNDSKLCVAARTLGVICGCSVQENACPICEASQNITRPQQSLDGLVVIPDFANEEFGLAFTCALAESMMQVSQIRQAECLMWQPSVDDLCCYCGCPSEDEEEESNECTLCPGGESIPPQSGVDTFIKIGKNEDKVSCEKAKTLAAQTEKDSEVAYATKSIELVHSVAVWFPRTHVNFAKLKSI